MVVGSNSIAVVVFMKAIGWMISQTIKVDKFGTMEVITSVIGKIISLMEKVPITFQMVQNTKVNIKKAKDMVRASLHGAANRWTACAKKNMSLKRTILETVSLWLRKESTMDNGPKTKEMGKVKILIPFPEGLISTFDNNLFLCRYFHLARWLKV